MYRYLKYESIYNIFLFIACEILYKALIIYRWIEGYRYDVSFSELCKVTFLSNRVSLGFSKIQKVLVTNQFLKIYLKGYSQAFYFPKNNFFTILYIIGENHSPLSWHFYETKETLITKQDIVVDCGAAVGTFTLSAAKKAKRVYAIEPFEDALKLLHLAFNKDKKVNIIPLAVGEKIGVAYMVGNIFGYGIQKSQTSTPIKITTIDKLFFDKDIKITYLKADLEGFEMNMLMGAKKTIRKYRPKIAITTYHKKNDHLIFMKFLSKLNSDYKFSLRGISWRNGNPIMLHAW